MQTIKRPKPGDPKVIEGRRTKVADMGWSLKHTLQIGCNFCMSFFTGVVGKVVKVFLLLVGLVRFYGYLLCTTPEQTLKLNATILNLNCKTSRKTGLGRLFSKNIWQ